MFEQYLTYGLQASGYETPEGLYGDETFRNGIKVLGRLGFTYDAWHYHYQNPAFTALARAVPSKKNSKISDKVVNRLTGKT